MKVLVTLRIFVLFILYLSSYSCQNEDEKTYMNPINNSWAKNDVQKFNFNVNDFQNQKDIVLIIRNNNSYPYSNIRLFAKIDFEKTNIKTDTLNYVLAEPNGEWIGTGFGDAKETNHEFKLNYKFPQNGNYTISVIQAMRNNKLIGIEDLGVKIQNIKPSLINGK